MTAPVIEFDDGMGDHVSTVGLDGAIDDELRIVSGLAGGEQDEKKYRVQRAMRHGATG
jgi:hypothetical protein